MKKSSGIFYTDGWNFLILLKNSKNKIWSIPGGKQEKNETSWETACRETREEIGTLPTGIEIGKFPDFHKKNYFVTYVVMIEKSFDCTLSEEHLDYKWINFDEINQYNLHERLLRKINLFKSYIFTIHEINKYKLINNNLNAANRVFR